MELSLSEVVRREGGRVVATLVRLTNDLGLAEDCFSEAAIVALQRWPIDGVPERPGAWLTTVARRRALDTMRREGRRQGLEAEAMRIAGLHDDHDDGGGDPSTIRDDQLRLIFTCCHPALAPTSQVALALRVLCGLTTAEIASAFLVPEATMGQRISRAKAKIAHAHIPYRIPPAHELPDRLTAVLTVVNVIYTTGHHAPFGATPQRVDLTDEAVRLSGLLTELMPDEPECLGLFGLLLSAQARAETRYQSDGTPVLLADADRTRWDHSAADLAVSVVERALRRGQPGPFQIQAAISCLHSVARTAADTDWNQIVTLYDLLESLQPSVFVVVNRAVAVAERDGPDAGLSALASAPEDSRWHFVHVARAQLYQRKGDLVEAERLYRRALECEPNATDRAYIEARLVGR